MMRKLLFCLSLFVTQAGYSQNSDTLHIKGTIDRFFEGMRTGDSLMIKSTVNEDCQLRSVIKNSSTGQTYVVKEEMDRFIRSVCQNREGILYDEKLQSYDIKIDGHMAIAWTPYRFYVNKRFSHCGVNVFSLVNLNGTWKIISILDTRRKQDCEEKQIR